LLMAFNTPSDGMTRAFIW